MWHKIKWWWRYDFIPNFMWRWSRNRFRWIYFALRQRCRGDDNWILNRRERYWFTIKAVISLLFNIKVGKHQILPDGYKYWNDTVVVAVSDANTVYSFDCYNAWDWTELQIQKEGLGAKIERTGNC